MVRTAQAGAALRPILRRFKRTVAYLRDEGVMADPPLSLEEAGRLFPGGVLALEQTVKQHEFAALLLERGIEEDAKERAVPIGSGSAKS